MQLIAYVKVAPTLDSHSASVKNLDISRYKSLYLSDVFYMLKINEILIFCYLIDSYNNYYYGIKLAVKNRIIFFRRNDEL
jgi:hypothetical protein